LRVFSRPHAHARMHGCKTRTDTNTNTGTGTGTGTETQAQAQTQAHLGLVSQASLRRYSSSPRSLHHLRKEYVCGGGEGGGWGVREGRGFKTFAFKILKLPKITSLAALSYSD
jgi:hypothetical protein